MHLPRENQRFHFDAHRQRFRAHEWAFAECRIVGDGDVVCGDPPGKNGKPELADFDFSIQRAGNLCFQLGAELVRIDKERECDDYRKQEHNQEREDFEYSKIFFLVAWHDLTSARSGGFGIA
jgi:hypothetical protein